MLHGGEEGAGEAGEGHWPRQPNVDMLDRERAASLLADSVASTEQKLEALRRPCKTFPAVTAWLEEHQNIADRKKFLVLGGPSRMGKTQFAMSSQPWRSVLDVNCAGCMEPRVAAIDVAVHSLILFDEASVALVLKQRGASKHPTFLATVGRPQQIRLPTASSCITAWWCSARARGPNSCSVLQQARRRG